MSCLAQICCSRFWNLVWVQMKCLVYQPSCDWRGACSILCITEWDSVRFRATACDSARHQFSKPSFETRYAYYSYSTPDPSSWQYFSTAINNTTKIATVLGLYGFRSFWNVDPANKANKGESDSRERSVQYPSNKQACNDDSICIAKVAPEASF
jgi:hypothetical protein